MVILELAEALQSPRGRTFLAEQGVTTNRDEFVARLEPPPRRELARMAGVARREPLLVYTGQQIYADYGRSVVAKLESLAQLAESGGIDGVLVWSDIDRSGADKAMTTISWPVGETKSVSLAARSWRSAEPRFVQLEPLLVRTSWRRLGAWLAQTVEDPRERRGAMARHAAIGAMLDEARTLADATRALTEVLMTDALGMALPAVSVSALLDRGSFTASVERTLNHIEDFIGAFNDGIERMRILGFNPQVRPRSEDYLPLYYSCPYRPDRMPLSHVRDGEESFAEANCSVHGTHRFSLGRGERSLAELEATGRWSPDVTLPLYLDDLVSGVVAGRSSAMYGIVLAWAQRKLLGTEPVPILVPEELGLGHDERAVDSLLFSYLTGTAW